MERQYAWKHERISRRLVFTLLLVALSWVGSAKGEEASRDELPPESDQFDFWLGAWDVNLRIRQDDGSWPGRVAAEARIYEVLDGKAVLELWDSEPIVGFSLRYFDPAEDAWVLWLNWPGENRSGGSELTGRFRHGRGEFLAARPLDGGGELLSKYTFSDVAADRLRWDDAYSSDGGETWSHRWIMEFSRTARRAPELPEGGGTAHTWQTGERCEAEPFRRFERLAGSRDGVLERLGADGEWTTTPAELVSYRILDGCAVLTFLRSGGGGGSWESLHLQTWHTGLSELHEAVLDRAPDSPLRLLHGPAAGTALELEGSARGGERPTVRHLWHLPGETTESSGEVRLEVETQHDGTWRSTLRARFPSAVP